MKSEQKIHNKQKYAIKLCTHAENLLSPTPIPCKCSCLTFTDSAWPADPWLMLTDFTFGCPFSMLTPYMQFLFPAVVSVRQQQLVPLMLCTERAVRVGLLPRRQASCVRKNLSIVWMLGSEQYSCGLTAPLELLLVVLLAGLVTVTLVVLVTVAGTVVVLLVVEVGGTQLGGKVKRPEVDVALTVLGATEPELELLTVVVVVVVLVVAGLGLELASITGGPLGVTVVLLAVALVLEVLLLVVPLTGMSAGLSTAGPALELIALTKKQRPVSSPANKSSPSSAQQQGLPFFLSTQPELSYNFFLDSLPESYASFWTVSQTVGPSMYLVDWIVLTDCYWGRAVETAKSFFASMVLVRGGLTCTGIGAWGGNTVF